MNSKLIFFVAASLMLSHEVKGQSRVVEVFDVNSGVSSSGGHSFSVGNVFPISSGSLPNDEDCCGGGSGSSSSHSSIGTINTQTFLPSYSGRTSSYSSFSSGNRFPSSSSGFSVRPAPIPYDENCCGGGSGSSSSSISSSGWYSPGSTSSFSVRASPYSYNLPYDQNCCSPQALGPPLQTLGPSVCSSSSQSNFCPVGRNCYVTRPSPRIPCPTTRVCPRGVYCRNCWTPTPTPNIPCPRPMPCPPAPSQCPPTGPPCSNCNSQTSQPCSNCNSQTGQPCSNCNSQTGQPCSNCNSPIGQPCSNCN